MYIKISEIPDSIRRGLDSVDYKRKDIEVHVVDKVSLGYSSGDGRRAFSVVGNIDTGMFKTVFGSWGGANMFTRTLVDDCDQEFEIPVNGYVITGCTGGYGHGSYATLHVSSGCVNKALLPDICNLSDIEVKVLACVRALRGDYRKVAIRRSGGSDEVVQGLVRLGYLNCNKAGSLSLTTKGKNACIDVPAY